MVLFSFLCLFFFFFNPKNTVNIHFISSNTIVKLRPRPYLVLKTCISIDQIYIKSGIAEFKRLIHTFLLLLHILLYTDAHIHTVFILSSL